MVVVLGIRGPAMGERIDVPEADVAAATAPDTGWAMLMEEGAVIYFYPTDPLSRDWVIPGYYIPEDLYPEERPPDPPDPPPPVAIAFISNEVVAKVHVAVADIDKFNTGDQVTVAGATGDFSVANGKHDVGAIDSVIGNFELIGIDTSAALAPSTDPGMTVTPAAAPPARSAPARKAPPPPPPPVRRRRS